MMPSNASVDDSLDLTDDASTDGGKTTQRLWPDTRVFHALVPGDA